MSVWKRSISLLLVLCFCLSLAPGAFAAEQADHGELISYSSDRPTGEELTAQIERVYKTLRAARGYNFKGSCGAFVRQQLVELGIIPNGPYSGHGKQQYDFYKDLEQTENGYAVTAYPASDYDIADALNEITADGTQDAYNILVGFEKGTGSNGRKYGHVILIHGILDGTVYFMECFKFNGKKEGTPHAMTIAEFAEMYAYRSSSREYQLDGLIHFQCAGTDTPTTATLSVNGTDFSVGEEVRFTLSTDVRCAYRMTITDADSGAVVVDKTVESTYANASLKAGHYRAQFHASNPVGAMDSNAVEFYVFDAPPSTARLSVDRTELEPGQTVTFTATSDADYAKLRMGLFLSNDTNEETQLPVEVVSASQSYTPAEPGVYTGYVTAYTHEGGADSNWVTLHVGSYEIDYDANGGTAAPDAQTKYYGKDISLTTAAPTREQYAFQGWATDPEAAVAEYQPGDWFDANEDTTLYAVWEIDCSDGHRYHTVTTAPNCLEEGCTTYTCECGDTFVDDYVDALGHDYRNDICTRCGQSAFDLWEHTENPFDDLSANSFCYAPVLWAVENGITNGVTETTFNPNDQCQRAHVVTFLWRAAGEPEPESTESPFVDVKPGDFYYKAVLWAVENGITNGISDTRFGPFTDCNRAQVVTFLYRAMNQPEITATESPFTDVESEAWYEAPILWAVEDNITNGMGDGIFGTNTICNRAQVVTFLYRAYN